MKANYRSPKIRRLVERATKMGWTVEFRDYVEDTETPGFLGHYGGCCIRSRKAIKVRIKGMTREQITAILEHELEHAEGAEWATDHLHLGLRCGGMVNGMGDPVGEPRPKK